MENQEKTRNREHEYAIETKEKKEEEMTEEARAAATRERVEYLVKEVKSSTQQIQNIVLHMQQVLTTIETLRAELALENTAEDPGSISQDKRNIERLKEKIATHTKELYTMKDELIAAIAHEEKTKKQRTHSHNIHVRAREMVETLLHDLSIQE